MYKYTSKINRLTLSQFIINTDQLIIKTIFSIDLTLQRIFDKFPLI